MPVLSAAAGAAGAGGVGGGRNAWQSGHGSIKHSRIGKWRALVLVLVHIAIAAHILYWVYAGTTISPVEPSESMETLKHGVVNAGFVFFALALVSTLIMGRWFCGWACHVVALQDACSWVMLKCGIKPKPFRSRLLLYVPLILALYMFVWPVFHRVVLRPLTIDARGRMPMWLGTSEPIPGITTEFVVHDFWSTFAPWYIAIPFLGISAVAIVYFLGSKGFCTYGCPYGGFFAPIDKYAPGKIKVNDNCEQCGHCTAVCTSNVRVHEEVRDFGMVIDPGCMKCMDCVSVCPNQALSFGFARPTVLAKPKNAAACERAAQARKQRAARYDLSIREEWLVAGLFLAFFLAYRQMMNAVPMLMAVGMAGIMAFCTWKLWKLRPLAIGGVPNIRLQNLQLRFRGRWKRPAYVLAALTGLMIVVAVWSGAVRITAWRAARQHEQLTTPIGIALRADFQAPPRQLAAAQRARELFALAGPFWKTDPLDPPDVRGFGWNRTPDDELALAYAHVVEGDLAGALARMDRIINRGRPQDSLVFQAGQLMQTLRKPEAEVVALYQRALDKHPELDGVRATLANYQMRPGGPGPEAARAMLTEPLNDKPLRQQALLNLARFEAGLGTPESTQRALEYVDRSLAVEHGRNADTLLAAAGALAQIAARDASPAGQGLRERAIALAKEAADDARRTGGPRIAAAGFLGAMGKPDLAEDLAARGLADARELGPHSGQIQTILGAANIYLSLGKLDQALPLYREAIDTTAKAMNQARDSGRDVYVASSAWDLHGIGAALLERGTRAPEALGLRLFPEAVRALELARDAAPDFHIIRADLAVAYYAQRRTNDALREMSAAAEGSDRNVMLARRLSELLVDMGRAQEGVEWERRAKEREAVLGPPPSDAVGIPPASPPP